MLYRLYLIEYSGIGSSGLPIFWQIGSLSIGSYTWAKETECSNSECVGYRIDLLASNKKHRVYTHKSETNFPKSIQDHPQNKIIRP